MTFATLEDLGTLWRPLKESEKAKASELLSIVTDELKLAAKHVGKDLDVMIVDEPELRSVVRSVTVDVVGRALSTPVDDTPMSQMSQSALGYTVSGTYLVPGGGIFIKKSELDKLGLRRQQRRVIEFEID